ncbi:MAG: LexA family protein [Cyanobium sp.]
MSSPDLLPDPWSAPASDSLGEAWWDAGAGLDSSVPVPLVADAGASGFPSPADDYIEGRIDLNAALIPRPLATFFMRVRGEAMRGDGIVDGDLLVIDRSVDARPGMVVVAVHEGEFLLRRLERRGGRLVLVASDGASPPIPLPSDPQGAGAAADTEIWGVVRHAVHHVLTPPIPRRGLNRAGPGAGR